MPNPKSLFDLLPPEMHEAVAKDMQITTTAAAKLAQIFDNEAAAQGGPVLDAVNAAIGSLKAAGVDSQYNFVAVGTFMLSVGLIQQSRQGDDATPLHVLHALWSAARGLIESIWQDTLEKQARIALEQAREELAFVPDHHPGKATRLQQIAETEQLLGRAAAGALLDDHQNEGPARPFSSWGAVSGRWSGRHFASENMPRGNQTPRGPEIAPPVPHDI